MSDTPAPSQSPPPDGPNDEQARLQAEVELLRLKREKARLEREISQIERPSPAPGGGRARGFALLIETVIGMTVLVLIALMIGNAATRLWDWYDDDPAPTVAEGATADDVLERAEEVLDAAESANNSASQVLSFLEAAGFLIALALGAAALFGFRSQQETREEFQRINAEVHQKAEQIQGVRHHLDQLPQYKRDLDEMRGYLDELQALPGQIDQVKGLQQSFLDLMQAMSELRLRNFRQAYLAVQRVLAQDPDNPQALYFAGWLEMQYVPGGKIEQARAYLEHALDQFPDWPAATAALGVALRRQAMHVTGEDQRKTLLAQAEGLLMAALENNPTLLDLNMESLWGPVGGLCRDQGRFEDAIDAYQRAIEVTPGSAYPRGNLASLLLRVAGDDAAKRDEALRAFERTREIAQIERATAPNDYFILVDLAMSTIMAGQRDPSDAAQFEEAFQQLRDAVARGSATLEMLHVSLRGMTYLHDYCPDDWDVVKGHLKTARDLLQQAIATRRKEAAAAPGADSPPLPADVPAPLDEEGEDA